MNKILTFAGDGTDAWDRCMGQIHGTDAWDSGFFCGDTSKDAGTEAWDSGISTELRHLSIDSMTEA